MRWQKSGLRVRFFYFFLSSIGQQQKSELLLKFEARKWKRNWGQMCYNPFSTLECIPVRRSKIIILSQKCFIFLYLFFGPIKETNFQSFLPSRNINHQLIHLKVGQVWQYKRYIRNVNETENNTIHASEERMVSLAAISHFRMPEIVLSSKQALLEQREDREVF